MRYFFVCLILLASFGCSNTPTDVCVRGSYRIDSQVGGNLHTYYTNDFNCNYSAPRVSFVDIEGRKIIINGEFIIREIR